MSEATKKMIRGWVEIDRGDRERTARWMAWTVKLGSVRQCRKFIEEAMA